MNVKWLEMIFNGFAFNRFRFSIMFDGFGSLVFSTTNLIFAWNIVIFFYNVNDFLNY